MDYFDLFEHFNSVEEMLLKLKELFQLSFSRNKDFEYSSNYTFRQLLKYVQEHYNESLNLQMLCKQYMIGFSYTSFLFRKVTGKTFNEFLSDLRLKQAHKLLQEGNSSVNEIALQVGYNAPYYFSKCFKKYYGFAPSQVREHERLS